MSNTDENKVASKAQWKRAATHPITLPSGTVVSIKIPDLPALIEAGQIPQTLLDAALKAAAPGGEAPAPSLEAIVQQREFTDTITRIAVVDPVLTEEDVKDVPYEDKEMIVEIATRQRDVDAVYKHIGGLEKAESFRRFRGFTGSDEDVESL